MTAGHITTWVDLLEKACAKVSGNCLDIIIDQAGSGTAVLASVRSLKPPLLWYSLFTGLPEEGMEYEAPLLVRIDLADPLQRQWLLGLMRYLDGQPRLLALVSPWPFPALAEHLVRCLEVSNGGYVGVLRYHDPRLFPLLFSHVLQPEQQHPWLCPAMFWSWLDQDRAPKRLAGALTAPVSADDFNIIELSDSQLEVLGCAADATAAMPNLSDAFPAEWSAEQRFQACYAAMLEATEAGVLMATQREAFTLDRLRNVSADSPREDRK